MRDSLLKVLSWCVVVAWEGHDKFVAAQHTHNLAVISLFAHVNHNPHQPKRDTHQDIERERMDGEETGGRQAHAVAMPWPAGDQVVAVALE